MKSLTILFCILLCVCACKQKEETTTSPISYCPSQKLLPVFSGYSYSEIDTIVLKKYKPGSAFSTLYSEIVLINPDTINSVGTSPLTIKNSFRNGFLNDDTDYVIHITALDTNYYISNISHTLTVATYSTNRYDGCKSYLNRFVMDNDTPSVTNGQLELTNVGSWYLLYIRR